MSTIENQDNVFLESEGDCWFERNKADLGKRQSFYEVDVIKRVLLPFKKDIRNIMEIGCGNGKKLRSLCEFFEANGEGVDPSIKAVEDGNISFQEKMAPCLNLNLKVSTAASLPYSNEVFDLVYFGFCLYLVDRSQLLKAIAEADRVLKRGGFLAILDFDPSTRHKRPYHHHPGLFSYKMSYSDFYTSGGHYYLVSKESFCSQANYFHKDSNERVSISILYKEMDPYL